MNKERNYDITVCHTGFDNQILQINKQKQKYITKKFTNIDSNN